MSLPSTVRALVIEDHWELTSALTPAACHDRLRAMICPWWSCLPFPIQEDVICCEVAEDRFHLRQARSPSGYPIGQGRIVADGSGTRIDLLVRTQALALWGLIIALGTATPILVLLVALASWSTGQVGPTAIVAASLALVWFQVIIWGESVPDVISVKWAYAGFVRDCLEATIVEGPPGANPDAKVWWRRLNRWQVNLLRRIPGKWSIVLARFVVILVAILAIFLIRAGFVPTGRSPHDAAIQETTPDVSIGQRGDPGRTGRQPGPGPNGEPVVRWRAPSSTSPTGMTVEAGVAYYAGADGVLQAVDARTGEQRWGREIPPLSGPPTVSGETVFVGTSGGLVALAAEDGAEAWRFEMPTWPPVVVDGVVYATTRTTFPDPGLLVALDAESGAVRWQLETKDGWVGGPAAIRDQVYALDRAPNMPGGVLAVVDATTGKQQFRFSPSATGLFWMAVTDDSLYVADQTRLYAYGAGGWSLSFLWKSGPLAAAPASGSALTLAASAGDTVYVGSAAGLHALNATNGTPRWIVGDGWVSRPSVVDGVVYAGVSDAVVAFDAATGAERWRLPAQSPAVWAVAEHLVFIQSTADGEILAIGGDADEPAATDSALHADVLAAFVEQLPPGGRTDLTPVDAWLEPGASPERTVLKERQGRRD